jgi:hypothetical protein
MNIKINVSGVLAKRSSEEGEAQQLRKRSRLEKTQPDKPMEVVDMEPHGEYVSGLLGKQSRLELPLFPGGVMELVDMETPSIDFASLYPSLIDGTSLTWNNIVHNQTSN